MLSPPVPCAMSTNLSVYDIVWYRGTYVAAGEVTTLEHELGDDAVEVGALVVEGLAGLAGTLLTSAEGAEVLGGLSIMFSKCLFLWREPKKER
jgi:hypothetical protein